MFDDSRGKVITAIGLLRTSAECVLSNPPGVAVFLRGQG